MDLISYPNVKLLLQHIPLKHVLSIPVEWVPLTLGDEWDTFSYGNTVAELPLSALPLSPELREKLLSAQCDSIAMLLDWTWERIQQDLGDNAAEEISDILLSLAQEAREAYRPIEPLAFGEKRKLLERCWAQCSVRQCGLKERTDWLLLAAKIRSIRELLDALDPLHPALCLDLPAFKDIWTRLVALELRQGDAQTEWERLLTTESCPIDLDRVVTEIQSVCKAKEWLVLNLRYGLRPNTSNTLEEGRERIRYTLEDIAKRLEVTRERVWQIEGSAFRNLHQHEMGSWHSLKATLCTFLSDAGGVMSVADVAQKLTSYIPAIDVNAEALCHLLFDLSEDVVPIQRGSIYCHSSFPAPYRSIVGYTLVIAKAVKIRKDSMVVLSLEELIDKVQQNLEAEGYLNSTSLVAACLRADGRFSSDFKRRDLNFHLVETLRQIGHPAHFTEIAAKLNESGWRRNLTSDKHVGSRLAGERDLFVYVDAGTYGLVEWGSEDKRGSDRTRNGHIGDIIEEFLTERGEPAGISEIVAWVLSRKRCSGTSIQQRLSNDDRFHALTRGRYGLKKWVM